MGQAVEDRRAAFGITVGRHGAGRLVEEPKAGALDRRQRRAVDLDAIAGGDVERRAVDPRAVHPHTAVGDHPFGVAARGDAGARQPTGDAHDAGHRSVFHRRAAGHTRAVPFALGLVAQGSVPLNPVSAARFAIACAPTVPFAPARSATLRSIAGRLVTARRTALAATGPLMVEAAIASGFACALAGCGAGGPAMALHATAPGNESRLAVSCACPGPWPCCAGTPRALAGIGAGDFTVLAARLARSAPIAGSTAPGSASTAARARPSGFATAVFAAAAIRRIAHEIVLGSGRRGIGRVAYRGAATLRPRHAQRRRPLCEGAHFERLLYNMVSGIETDFRPGPLPATAVCRFSQAAFRQPVMQIR